MLKDLLNTIEKKAQKFVPELTSIATALGMFSSILLFIHEIIDAEDKQYNDTPRLVNYILSSTISLLTLLAVWYQLRKFRHINVTNMSNAGRILQAEIHSTGKYAKKSYNIACEFIHAINQQKQGNHSVNYIKNNIDNIKIQNQKLKKSIKQIPSHPIKPKNIFISILEALYTSNNVIFAINIYDNLFKHEDINSGFELHSFIPTAVFFLIIACLDIYKWKRFDQYTKYLPEANALINDINSVRQSLKDNIKELIQIANSVNHSNINNADLKQLAPLLSSLTILPSQVSPSSRTRFMHLIRNKKYDELKDFLDAAKISYFNKISNEALSQSKIDDQSHNDREKQIHVISQIPPINEASPLLSQQNQITQKNTILNRITHAWYMLSILCIDIQAVGYFLNYFALPPKTIIPGEIIFGVIGFLFYLNKHNEYKRSAEKFSPHYLMANILLKDLKSTDDIKRQINDLKNSWETYQSTHFQTTKIAKALIDNPDIQESIKNNNFWK